MNEKFTCKLSIIIPVYNKISYIRRCLESFIHQIDNQVEVILVDDCSNDGSTKVLEEYEREFDNIHLICHKQNEGVSVSRNDGILSAKGEWITFCDADDFFECNAIKEIFQNMVLDADFEMFFHKQIDSHSHKYQDKTRLKNIEAIDRLDRDILIKNIFVSNPSEINGRFHLRSCDGKIFKKSFLIDNQIFFDPVVSIGEDMLFMLKTFSSFRKGYLIPISVYCYYLYVENSITNRYKPDLEKILYAAHTKFMSWIKMYPQYLPYYYCYKLNDIILYLKFDLFNVNNREKDSDKFIRMRKVLEPYNEYYRQVKLNGLIKYYELDKRIIFTLVMMHAYYLVKFIVKTKYS